MSFAAIATRCVMNMSNSKNPIFVQQVGGTKNSLKRSNCFHFKTKSNLKRHEVIDLWKRIEYPISKLIGVAEMKSQSIDTRENVLELFSKLKTIDHIYSLNLYETENTQILVGWVPMPMPNERIQNYF